MISRISSVHRTANTYPAIPSQSSPPHRCSELFFFSFLFFKKNSLLSSLHRAWIPFDFFWGGESLLVFDFLPHKNKSVWAREHLCSVYLDYGEFHWTYFYTCHLPLKSTSHCRLVISYTDLRAWVSLEKWTCCTP